MFTKAPRVFLRLLSALMLIIPLSSLDAQEKLLNTVRPGELIAALPAAPPEWKALESKAQRILSVSGMPNTTAIRRYELPPPELPQTAPPPAAGAEVPPPPLLRIIALDRGSRSPVPVPTVVPGQQLKPEQQIVQIGALKGRLRQYAKRMVFETTGEQRLTIQLEGRNLTEGQFRRIIASLNWRPLLALEPKLPTDIVHAYRDIIIENYKEIPIWVYEVENERVDELNPARNRKWKTSQYSR